MLNLELKYSQGNLQQSDGKHQDQPDDFVTQTSDIPVFDVLGNKYFASPDKLEFIRKNFLLPDLKTVSLGKQKTTYDPVLNKHLYGQQNQKFGFKNFHDTERHISQNRVLENTDNQDKVKETTSKKYNAFENKEIKETSTSTFVLIPATEPVNKELQASSIQTLVTRKSKAEQMQLNGTDWATGIFIGLLLLLTYTRIAFGKFFSPMFQSVFIYNLSVRIYSEKSLVMNRLSTILNFMFVITIAVFINLCFDFYGFKIKDFRLWEQYLVFLSMIMIIYLARKILHFIISAIFGIREIVSEFSFHGNLFLKLSGILILPLTMAIPYIPENQASWLILAVVIILIVVYLLRILRTFSITIRKGFSIFYLILYLCALEIGPCIVLLKLMSQST